MVKLLLAGASGMVGSALLRQALQDPRIESVLAPGRRVLPAHPRLRSPQVDFDALPAQADWWPVDAVICALGTTLRDAGSRAAFRKVDHAYPLALARLARTHGVGTFVLTSASGADPRSRLFYSRTKGELECELATLGFDSLTLVRPALLGGRRETHRPLEKAGMRVLGALDPLLPRRYRVVPAEAVARSLLQAAVDARPGLHVIESEEIARSPQR